MTALADPARLDALRRSGLLRKGAGERLDHLAYSAREVLHADRAELNVLDADNQRHVCAVPGPPTDHDLPAEISGCRLVILADEVVAITDSYLHPVVCDLPWAGIYRAYLGAPVRYAGQVIGSLCVLGSEPREWDLLDRVAITGLADLVSLSVDR